MIGIVIWSSEARRRAIIWCEDQGPLAYLRGCDSLLGDRAWPLAGDLLRVECEMIGNLRHAFDAHLIAAEHCPQLRDALLNCTRRLSPSLQVVTGRAEMSVKQHLSSVPDPDPVRGSAVSH
ncbi:hypothetical protein [Paracoccus aerodenitrificans]|uniref:hypothetical protein n=1 Tax=Paracoccus aerodenitrificans TaxID=3017781 RepID=UPI0022F08687|nr:hypothetical protein [Paracoccus aerodenitrificans]WBU64417.1 hypothetical protein PAE61_02935 [Paracoccus aerodenitrificans]